jgi:hypothetical protein
VPGNDLPHTTSGAYGSKSQILTMPNRLHMGIIGVVGVVENHWWVHTRGAYGQFRSA